MGTNDLSRGERFGYGALLGAIGLLSIALGVHSVFSSANPIGSDLLGVVSFGLIWVFGGVLIVLPPGNSRWRDLFGTVLVTCLALMCDWVAFAPGERIFTSGVSHGGTGAATHVKETTGRVVFGAAAVVLDAVTVFLWIRLFRKAAKT
jgi:hypothetical protein